MKERERGTVKETEGPTDRQWTREREKESNAEIERTHFLDKYRANELLIERVSEGLRLVEYYCGHHYRIYQESIQSNTQNLRYYETELVQ